MLYTSIIAIRIGKFITQVRIVFVNVGLISINVDEIIRNKSRNLEYGDPVRLPFYFMGFVWFS